MARRATVLAAAPAAALAIVLAVLSGWSSLTSYLWTDYELANEAPFRALVEGRLHDFFIASPVEGPSLLLRAPFALLADLLGGGDMAIYRLVAVPGLLAGVAFGVVLWAARVRRFPDARWPLLVVALAAGNPTTLRALEIGHPEELLGAVLCAGAVLAALARRPWLAAVLLGFAIANKAWALLAIAPVLLALDRQRVGVLAVAGAITLAFVAPFLLVSAESREAVLSGGASTDVVFQPWQVWWYLGEHGHEIRGFTGTLKVDYRAAPTWLAPVTHPLVAVLGPVMAAAWWLRRRAAASATRTPDVLLLLALIFLMRCVLDVANNGYYHLPFLMALLAWETVRSARPPVWSLLGVVAVWTSFEWLPRHVSPDVQAAGYLVWALPATAALTWAVYRRPGGSRRAAAAPAPTVAGAPATA